MADELEGSCCTGGAIGPRTWRFGVTGGDSKAKEMKEKGMPKSINAGVAAGKKRHKVKARRQDVEGCPGAHVRCVQ